MHAYTGHLKQCQPPSMELKYWCIHKDWFQLGCWSAWPKQTPVALTGSAWMLQETVGGL